MSIEKKQSVLVRWIRGLVLWVCALCVVAGALWFAYIYGGNALCHIAIGQIAEITNTRIETGSVEFHRDGSVTIKKLVISPFKRQDPNDRILRAEEVYGRFDIASLLKLKPRLKRIDVNDFVFNARYDLDSDKWNLSSLKIPAPKSGADKLPLINLNAGKLQYCKSSEGETKIAATMPFNATFELDEPTEQGYAFGMTTAVLSSGFGESRLRGFWKPGIVTIAGGISSADVPELEMAWTIDVLAAELEYSENDNYQLKLRVKDLHSKLSPALDRFAQVGPGFVGDSACFGVLQRFFTRFQPRGTADISVDMAGNFGQLARSTLTGKVDCKDVGIRYYKFDYPVDELAGTIDFTQNGVNLNNLRGRHNDVDLYFNGWSRGFGLDWKYDISVTSGDMALDNDLFEALSDGQKKMWSLVSPSGMIGLNYHITRASPDDKSKVISLELDGVEATYRNFPYPLEGLTGKVTFARGAAQFSDVVSQTDDRRIVINGEVGELGGDRPDYCVQVDVENVPLDSTLQESLPEKQRQLYEQFHPDGLADGTILVSRSNKEGQFTYTADMKLKNALLDCNDLPFPLSDVSAHIVFSPNQADIQELEGQHDETSLSLKGLVKHNGSANQKEYSLSLAFSDAEINGDLLDLVPEGTRKAVAGLNPEGKVNLTVELENTDGNKPTDYSVTVECLGNSFTLPQFPYPLKDVYGTLKVSPGTVVIEELAAAPGHGVWARAEDSAIWLNGLVTMTDGTFDNAVLGVRGRNIFFESGLAESLPSAMRVFHDRLRPSGLFDMDMNEVRITRGDNGKSDVEFDGEIMLKRCRFGISGAITNIRDALLATEGVYKADAGFSNCTIGVDANNVRIQGKALTDLKAHLAYDPNLHKWSTNDIIADCYGGKLLGSFDFNQPQEGPFDYLLQAVFDDMDLGRFLADTRLKDGSGNGHSSGSMKGTLSLSAKTGDSSSRIGKCTLSIKDMQVGRLSPLVNMFQVLKLSVPTEFAFDRMYLDSYIKKSDLIVKKLDLAGESLAFYGSGLMDLETRNVDLKLTGRGKRLATSDPSLIASLTEGIGRAMVRIDVTGSFYDPVVETKPLPIITGTLDIFGKVVGSGNRHLSQ